MDALKKFITKKKADSKFKAAGPGQQLSDSSSRGSQKNVAAASSRSPGQHSTVKSPSRASVPTDEKRQAAMAALARVEKEKAKKGSNDPNDFLASRQLAYIKEQARKEIQAEQSMKELELGNKNQSQNEEKEGTWKPKGKDINPETMAVSGVFFTCPLLGPEVLPRHEIEANILQFLLEPDYT